MKYEKLPWRISDQKVFIADIIKANKELKWSPSISSNDGIGKMIDWCKSCE